MSSIIRCKNISKRFGSSLALDKVSFELDSGAPIALVGPNGAGKTTLFSLLCAYIHPSSGSISLLGHKPGSSKLFGQVSALPQDAQLDPSFTIHKQLSLYARLQGYGSKAAKIEASRVLELMQLTNAMTSMPSSLSHGMRKRVAIAQALIGKPKLVFLDEPTAGLDPENARNIRQQISFLSDSTTFVISSHNLQELEQLCETVLLLERGQLLQKTQVKIKSKTQWDFLTLLMNDPQSQEVQATFQDLSNVESITSKNKNEFVIKYNHEKAPDLDQQLLKMLSEKGWSYRQLTRGKTLEDQLFNS
ncbi:MAG: ABC-2 type transport system ATP-binding protein [Oleiphilaceae bacterium]|jgi:ABC-type multidrug transport system ATPase subunit